MRQITVLTSDRRMDMFPVGTKVGIHVDPFDIQIMNKPESEDEQAVMNLE